MKLRTKIEIIIAISISLMMIIPSIFAITRTISDTGDTVYTYIINSRGNCFNVTDDGLQMAIWDLNDTNGGFVRIPNCTIDITPNPIVITTSVSLYGAGVGYGGIPTTYPVTRLRVGAGYSGGYLIEYNASILGRTIQCVNVKDIAFDGRDWDSSYGGLYWEGVWGSTIQNCYFDDFYRNYTTPPCAVGINITSIGATYPSYYNQIINCHVRRTLVGIEFSGGANDNTIIGGSVTLNTRVDSSGEAIGISFAQGGGGTILDMDIESINNSYNGTGIKFISGYGTSIIGTRFEGNYRDLWICDSIVSYGYQTFTGCKFLGLIWDNATTKSRFTQSYNYDTEMTGNVTIAAGSQSVVVTHGLGDNDCGLLTPTCIIVTPTSNLSTATWWVNNASINNVNFTINISVALGTDSNFKWFAKYGNS